MTHQPYLHEVGDLMKVPATQAFACFADRVPERMDARLHFKLLEYLGQETGHALGSPEAVHILGAGVGSNWLYDRGTELLIPCYTGHNMIASLLYCMHKQKGIKFMEEDADNYVLEDMGFWQSSASKHGNVLCRRGISLTAQEKMAFKAFNFRSSTSW